MASQKDIRVIVAERDIFARQAIVSYMSWDRHTRVVDHVGSLAHLFSALGAEPHHGFLDAVILDVSLVNDTQTLSAVVILIQQYAKGTAVICLVQEDQIAMVDDAYAAGVRGFLSREQVGIGISAAVRYVLDHDFVVTRDLASMSPADDVHALPARREYPRLTQRIEQALWLCVVEGLPAELAAEEMGVSISTVRSYIKEGYRILESADDTEYPADMSPVERAFRRYSDLDGARWKPAA